MDLPSKHEAFAAGVAQGLSQSEAYRQAFPNSLKWKDETVWSRASELMADRKVSGRVSELMAKAAAANEVTQERIVAELAKVAFGDKRALMKWGPNGVLLIDSDTLQEDAVAMVSEVQETVTKDGGSIRLKTHDKVKALELLGRHCGMFTDKVHMSGTLDVVSDKERVKLMAQQIAGQSGD